MKKLCLLLGLAIGLCYPASMHAQSIAIGTSDAEGSSVATQGATCNITTTSLPPATQGTAYTATLAQVNCVGTLTWSVSSGALPTGLSLNATTGAITGTPTSSGTTSFRVGVVDSVFNTDIYDASLSITAAPSTGGPLLPDTTLLTWNTARSATPASGPYVCVGTLVNAAALSGGCSASYTTAQLQTALNSLVCGNILVLQNTVYTQTNITIPNVVCPNSNWIWVTRDITDTTFPAEGQRVDPSFAGLPHSVLSSYPYPTWNTNQNSTTRHMPVLIAKVVNGPAISFKEPSSGTGVAAPSHWRFIGIELTRDQSGDIFTALVDLSYDPAGAGQDCATNPLFPYTNQTVANTALMVTPTNCMNVQPNNIIFDQMFVHGDAQRQTARAFNFAGVLHVALLDSYGYDIQLTAAGGSGDAQYYFWGGGHGFGNVGYGKFINNFTASSTMASLFCGAFTETLNPVTGSDGVPHDVWWAQDFMFKNPLWNTQNGQTLLEPETIEGRTYPAANDQELTLTPPALQLAQGQTFQLQITVYNDSFGGLNRMASSNVTGGGSFTIDPSTGGGTCTFVGNTCLVGGSSALGVITKNGEHNVGSTPWTSANQVTYTYTACTGSGAPLSVCNVATTLGPHVVTAGFITVDTRAATLGNSRTVSGSTTITVVASNPTKLIAVSPNVSDLQIQPSYSDSNGNIRQFCYTMFEFANYTTASITWNVNGIAGGNATIGTVTTPSGVSAGEAIYCSGTGSQTVNITATDGTVTSAPSTINVNTLAPIVGYDLKAYTSKNGWELKCGSRVLLEKSLIELGWGGNGNGGGQQGKAMLIQAINQTNQVTDGNGVTVNYGPVFIDDTTVRYNTFRHFGAGFTVAPLNVAKGTHRISITHNVCDDCNYTRWSDGFIKIITAFSLGGSSSTTNLSWTSATTPTSDNIFITHNTIVGNFTSPFSLNNYITQFQLINYKIQDNIIESPGSFTFVNATGENNDANQATGSGASNTEALAFQGAGWNPVALGSCKTPKAGNTFYCNVSGTGWEVSNNGGAYASVATPPGFVLVSPYVFDHNNLMGSTAAAGNFSSSPIWQLSSTATGFVNYNSGNTGDYRLCTTVRGCATNSIFAAGQADQASDGTDLGADATSVMTYETAARTGTRTP